MQIGGRRVGSITDIKLTERQPGRGRHRGRGGLRPAARGHARRVIRATSLSGIANRYIALTPGNGERARRGRDAPAVERRRPIVDLDQLFNTLDEETRKALQQVIQGSADAVRRARATAPTRRRSTSTRSCRRRATSSTRSAATSGRCERFIVDGAKAMTALAEKRDDAHRPHLERERGRRRASPPRATRSREILAELPGTMRRANSTFVNLRSTLTDLDVLVAESKPATKDLAPFFRELRPLVRDARPTIRDLRLAITRAGPEQRPRRADAARRRASQQVADARVRATRRRRCASRRRCSTSSGPYAPDLTGWFRDFGQSAGELRRERPLRAHPADVQHLPVHGQRRRAASSPRRTRTTR